MVPASSHSPAVLRQSLRLAALALAFAAPAAMAQTEASAPRLSAQRIVIDSVTGRPRMPDHEEVAAMKESAAAASGQRAAARSAGPEMSDHPVVQRMQAHPLVTRFGATGRRVGMNTLSFNVVRRTADGKFETQCVAGEDAATHALHADVKETSHAQ